uniref:Myb-like domain-containing protein n=1 Tax=Brassica oleracea var. oleracea TaxID=109376 RepID=A0A0D3AHZ7_BRAOL
MDSRHPYSHSSSYVGLLNSQNDSVLHGNFPYESFPSSLNIGASEISPFSSQQSEAPTLQEDTLVERRERRKWTPADDEVLISVWLNTSKDTIVGNEQKAGTFWKRLENTLQQVLMLKRVVTRGSISTVSRGGTKSMNSLTSSVTPLQLQRDSIAVVRVRMMF